MMSLVNIIEEDASDEEFKKFLTSKDKQNLTLIFTTRTRLNEDPLLREKLFQRCSIPEYVWSEVCKRLQGYFGSEDIFCEDETTIRSHVTWFHFEVKFPFKELERRGLDGRAYEWYKMGVTTTWTEPNHHTIIFFDAAKSVQNELKNNCEKIKASPAMRNPYWAHQFLLGPIVACYDTAVWNLRDRVRALEDHRRSGKSISRAPTGFEPITQPQGQNFGFNDLHEILRHALHTTEILGVAIQTMSSICNRQKTLDDENLAPEKGAPKQVATKLATVKRCKNEIAGYLAFKQSIVISLEARAKANEARIRSEITLAFSTVAQLDSQVQAEIGQAAQADSYAMKAIAVVTMIFLPSTSVSAILSTTFFDFKVNDGERVSRDFWIYWAVSVPLTALVVIIWYFWDRRHPGKRAVFSRSHVSTATKMLNQC